MLGRLGENVLGINDSVSVKMFVCEEKHSFLN